MCNILSILRTCAALFCIFLSGTPVFAIGIVIPRTPDAAPPILTKVGINAEVTDNIAKTRITQFYSNPNSRPVEADFYFPVPAGSNITDFVLYMDGKPVRGEVLDKDDARQTYRDIVRRLKDPGLIEWADEDLFRVRIFPIPANGEQKLEIELTQPLESDQGFFKYSLPLQTNRHPAQAPLTDLKLDIALSGKAPIRNVFSPTHKIETNTSSTASGDVKVSLASDNAAERANFLLFYETSKEDIAVGLLAHKTTDEQGYFSLRISPPWQENSTSTQAADYLFVIDSSGSMTADNKMEQAKNALQYCVNSLSPGDRFNIVRFSSSVEVFRPELQPADRATVEAAADWIDNLRAHGGTNISGALETALELTTRTATTATDAPRHTTVVFITDGLPTVGETSPEKIIDQATKSRGNSRIFTFGLGNDVNTRLLDSIAEKSAAASDYIAPETDLEVPISRFFDKISRPAMVNPRLEIPGVDVTEVFPPDLPDMFYGTDLSVFGRYRKPGPTTITLTGIVAGEQKSYQFHKVFAPEEENNGFVEKLWATRKVAWLLDQVRMSGESDELKTEITSLAKKYSIVTPYTSYLAMEDKAYDRADLSSPGAGTSMRFNAQPPASVAGQAQEQAHTFALQGSLKAESGAVAVNTARRLQAMKSADVVTVPAATPTAVRSIGDRTFRLEGDVWVDTSIDPQSKTLQIQTYSEAWFHVSKLYPDLDEVFALGEKVRVQLFPGAALETGPSGIESAEVITQRISEIKSLNKK